MSIDIVFVIVEKRFIDNLICNFLKKLTIIVVDYSISLLKCIFLDLT